MNAFVASEVDRLTASGWSSCPTIAAFVRDRGLPAITREHLLSEFSPDEWQRSEQATQALTRHLGSASRHRIRTDRPDSPLLTAR